LDVNVPHECIQSLDPILVHPVMLSTFISRMKETYVGGGQHYIAFIQKFNESNERVGSRYFIIVLEVVRIWKEVVRISFQIMQRDGDGKAAGCFARHCLIAVVVSFVKKKLV
jgi:hypothetical protein